MLLRPCLKTRSPYVRVVIAVWLIWLTYAELFSFYVHVSRCDYPTLPGNGDVIHVAVIVDPQLVDVYSYLYMDNPAELTEDPPRGVSRVMLEFLCDAYMKKAYAALMRLRRPDAVIIGGDVFEGAREYKRPDLYAKHHFVWYFLSFLSIFVSLLSYFVPIFLIFAYFSSNDL